MYLCIYVSMHLCIYVSMCLCIYVSIYVPYVAFHHVIYHIYRRIVGFPHLPGMGLALPSDRTTSGFATSVQRKRGSGAAVSGAALWGRGQHWDLRSDHPGRDWQGKWGWKMMETMEKTWKKTWKNRENHGISLKIMGNNHEKAMLQQANRSWTLGPVMDLVGARFCGNDTHIRTCHRWWSKWVPRSAGPILFNALQS